MPRNKHSNTPQATTSDTPKPTPRPWENIPKVKCDFHHRSYTKELEGVELEVTTSSSASGKTFALRSNGHGGRHVPRKPDSE